MAARLGLLRNCAGMTRRAVGERVAVGPDQVRRWERGDEPIPDPYPALLALVFEVDVRFLAGESEA